MQVVASYQVSAFVTPVNETSIDADQVRGNDNAVRAALNSHDGDSGVHFQSSTLALRPAAGTAGRKWMTSDDFRIFFDDGSNWREAAYAPTASPTFTGTLTIPASVVSSSNTTLNIGGLGALQLGGGSIQLDQGGFKTNAAALLLNASAVAGVINLQTNGAIRWQVQAAGHLLPQADLTYDIGSVTNRLRNLYIFGTITFGGVGNFLSSAGFTLGGSSVLTAAKTGWTTDPTGTLTRTTFISDSVTLPNLAARVAALIVDLRSHGMIGA